MRAMAPRLVDTAITIVIDEVTGIGRVRVIGHEVPAADDTAPQHGVLHVRAGVDDGDLDALAGRDVMRTVEFEQASDRLLDVGGGRARAIIEREALLTRLGGFEPGVGFARDHATVDRELIHERAGTLTRDRTQ